MLTTFTAAVLLAGTAVAAVLDCIPEGGSTDITQRRPDLKGDGMPAGAKWKDGDGAPDAWDTDTWSGDDCVGDATPSDDGETATVSIRNVGGHLYGPNGADVEDWPEGECLEVHISWWYRYQVDVERCVTIGGEGGSYQECVTVRIWVTDWVEGPEVEVCPC